MEEGQPVGQIYNRRQVDQLVTISPSGAKLVTMLDLMPNYYTMSNGGIWHDWPHDIGAIFMIALHAKRSSDSVQFLTTHNVLIKVHALCFGDPAGINGNQLVWDCISGFRNDWP